MPPQTRATAAGKPYIFVSGDNDNSAYLLVPASQSPGDWSYATQKALNCAASAPSPCKHRGIGPVPARMHIGIAVALCGVHCAYVVCLCSDHACMIRVAIEGHTTRHAAFRAYALVRCGAAAVVANAFIVGMPHTRQRIPINGSGESIAVACSPAPMLSRPGPKGLAA